MGDMKADEIKSMVTMLQVLYKESKLRSSDITSGMSETIEFLDSLIFDCPKIFFYIGGIVCTDLGLSSKFSSKKYDYFGRLIFQYASFNNSRALHFFLGAWPVF